MATRTIDVKNTLRQHPNSDGSVTRNDSPLNQSPTNESRVIFSSNASEREHVLQKAEEGPGPGLSSEQIETKGTCEEMSLEVANEDLLDIKIDKETVPQIQDDCTVELYDDILILNYGLYFS